MEEKRPIYSGKTCYCLFFSYLLCFLTASSKNCIEFRENIFVYYPARSYFCNERSVLLFSEPESDYPRLLLHNIDA